ncbi:hypothetical protein [Arthrobacter crystallopoietes]|uniref:hypothetical protein n=1 Tax=Crystallibacter crystallopoietes TaxID=37928 RepID=UPI001ABDCAF6|nr:hypothetical protein [Arthrobacter crystallopoietes]QTG82811.1 hypothetical protein J5251_09995 [Arthrobacter crystallopoietes]
MRVERLSRVPVVVRKLVLTAAATAGFALFGIAGASAADADDGLLPEMLSSEAQSTTAALTGELIPITDNVGALTGKPAPVAGELAATEDGAPVVEEAAAPVSAVSETVVQAAQPVTAAAHEVAGAVASVSDPVLESVAPLAEPVLEAAAPVVEAAAKPIVDAAEAGGLVGETTGSNETITVDEDGPTADASSVSVAVAEVPSIQLADSTAEVVPADTAAGTSDSRQEEREAAPAPTELPPPPAQFLAQIAHAPSAVTDQHAHSAARDSYPGQPVAATPTAVPAGVGGSGTATAGGSASAGQGAADVPFSHLLPPLANSGTADGSAWSLPASRSSDPGSSPD